MKPLKRCTWMLGLAVLFLTAAAKAQDTDTSAAPKKKLKDIIQLNGYVKFLQTETFSSLDTIFSDNLIHNRINLKGYISPSLTAVVEVRNRLFYGDQVRLIPGYGKMIAQDNGYVNMSWLIVNRKALVLHSMIDRAYLDWNRKKWNIRLGRQRINWGLNLVWNPNDLFNAYNFLDFDYEERPGSDAVRLRYFTGDLSSAELAIRPGRNKNETVAAGLYKFNFKGYDIQLLGGLYRSDYVLGLGWAGNIKGAGFKGEASWFQDRTALFDTSGQLSASVSADYAFKNTWYLNGSILYNSGGSNKLNGFSQAQLLGTLSAKNLMPGKWTYFLQTSRNITPLWQASLSTMYAQGINVLFAMPNITYSIKENWDLNFIGELFYGKRGNDFGNLGNYVFLRLKWSY